MEHFFFGEKSQRLFGVLDGPADARTALVFCPPFGEEMVATYARLARWSKELAERGFMTLRYHARGTGESDGCSADFTLLHAAEDVATAVRWLRERHGAQRVGIFGLRFGASAAVHARAMADFFVFWSPVINLRQYCRDLLRLRVTTDMVQLRTDQVKVTTKDLTAQLESGRTVDVIGYDISPDFYRQMTANMSWPDDPPAPDVLCVGLPSETGQVEKAVAPWKSRACRVDVAAFRAPVFWEDFSLDFPHKFAESSIAWMERESAEVLGV